MALPVFNTLARFCYGSYAGDILSIHFSMLTIVFYLTVFEISPRCLQGLFKIAKGFLGRAGHLMIASDLEKSDLGKNWFYSALNMPYPNGKIIEAERVRTFIGYREWPITLQLPLDTLASLFHCVVGARFEFEPCQPGEVEMLGPPR